MATNGVSLNVNGVILRSVQDVQNAVKAGVLTAEQGRQYGALFGAPQKDDGAGVKVETNPTVVPKEQAEELQAQRSAANQKAIEEQAALKEKAEQDIAAMQEKDPAKFATDTKTLKGGLSSIDTKEEAAAAGFKHARKISRAARKDLTRIDTFEAVEKVFTDEAAYEDAVRAAKKDGTWDKNLPKYTLLKGKALEGARQMAKDSAAQLDKAKLDYAKYQDIFDNAASRADKIVAFREMCKAAETISKNYNPSQMFDKDGNINTDAYKSTMLQYSGTDFKGNLDERRALKESANVKKHTTKAMFEAAGLDVEKDYTWAMKGGALVAGVGTGALIGLLGGGVAAHAVANAVATATSSVTATASATATANAGVSEFVHWEATNGEEFEQFFEQAVSTTVTNSATETATKTVTETGTATATAAISSGEQALRGAIGALPAAILSAVLIKDTGGKDAFNGLTALQVLNNAKQVRGKANRELVQKIIDMKNITTSQKAAILQAAYADNTAKKVNTQELVAAYTAAKYLDEHPELVTPQKGTTPEPTTLPPTTTPPDTETQPTTEQPTTEPTKPCTDIEEKDSKATLPIIQYRTGTWYIANGYVKPDGTNLTQKQISELQRLLKNATDYSLSTTGRRNGLLVPQEVTLADGTVVKLADDAAQRIAKLPARGGGRNPKYNVATNGKLMRAVDCNTRQPLCGWMTPEDFARWQDKH